MYIFNVQLYVNSGVFENLPIRSLGTKRKDLEDFEIHKMYNSYEDAIIQLGMRYCKLHNFKYFSDGNYLLYFYNDNPKDKSEVVRKTCQELEEELDFEPEKTDCLKLGKIFNIYINLEPEKARELKKVFDFMDVYDCITDYQTIKKIVEIMGIRSSYFDMVGNPEFYKFLMKLRLEKSYD